MERENSGGHVQGYECFRRERDSTCANVCRMQQPTSAAVEILNTDVAKWAEWFKKHFGMSGLDSQSTQHWASLS
jgi:hypothetical protein